MFYNSISVFVYWNWFFLILILVFMVPIPTNIYFSDLNLSFHIDFGFKWFLPILKTAIQHRLAAIFNQYMSSTQIRNKKVFYWKIVRNLLIPLANYYERWDEFYRAWVYTWSSWHDTHCVRSYFVRNNVYLEKQTPVQRYVLTTVKIYSIILLGFHCRLLDYLASKCILCLTIYYTHLI